MPSGALELLRDGRRLLTGRFDTASGYGTQRARGTADWLLILTLAGSGRIAAGNQTHATGPGEALLWRPGTPHDYRTAEPPGRWELAWAHFLPDEGWLSLLDWPELAPGVMRLQLDGEPLAAAGAAFDDCRLLSASTWPQAERLGLNALERALLWMAAARPDGESARLDPRVRGAVEAIARDLARPPSIAALARQAGLSPSRFAHLFSDQLGMGVAEWRDRRRIARACELLAVSGLPVQEVALAVGFADPFHFSTRFRRFTGTSPRAWRRAR